MRMRAALASIATAGAFRAGKRARRVVALLVAATMTALGAVGAAAAPAQATESHGYGMALWEGVARPVNATPAGTTVTPGTTGRYQVVFPGEATLHGIVHVAAVNAGPVWCQVLAFRASGADEVVSVGCYRAGGTPTDTSFGVSFYGSNNSTLPSAPDQGKFGFVDARADGAIVSGHNSVGEPNAVTLAAVGAYKVRLPGLGAPGGRRGGLQATAVSPTSPVRCKVANWTTTTTAQDVLVYCHNAAGVRVNSRFTLTFHDQPRHGELFPWEQFGYVWRQGPTAPAATNFNSVLGVGGNRVMESSTGQVVVELPRLTTRPDTVQLAAFGVTSDFCAIVKKWVVAGVATVVPGIRCYTTAGVATDPAFLLWYGNNPA